MRPTRRQRTRRRALAVLIALVVVPALAVAAAAAFGAPHGPVAAGDDRGAAPAALDLRLPSRPLYEGERVPLAIEVHIHEDLVPSLAPLSGRRLDLPVRACGGVLAHPELEPLVPRGQARTLALCDRVVSAEVLPPEHGFARFRVEARVPAAAFAAAQDEPPSLRFDYAVSFRESVLEGRVPERLETVTVRSEPSRAEVVPLPQAGRPADFSGGVGRFDVEARPSPDAPTAGRPLSLALVITGDGDLSAIRAPDLAASPAFSGFAVQGHLDELRLQDAPPRRVLRYDLVTPARATAIPALRLAVFDPTLARYVSLATSPISLAPGPSEAAPAEHAKPRPGSRLVPLLITAVLGAVLGGWFGRRWRRTHQARRASEGVDTRLWQAADRLARMHGGASPEEVHEAYSAALAAWLGRDALADSGKALEAALLLRGAGAEAAAAASALHEDLTVARYAPPSTLPENVRASFPSRARNAFLDLGPPAAAEARL